MISKDGVNNQDRYFSTKRQAIYLCYDPGGPKLTYAEASRLLGISEAFVENWVKYYQQTGLLGHMGQRQAAILCIYKKDPNITLREVNTILKKMGITISNTRLVALVNGLQHIITSPTFVQEKEEVVMYKIKELTKIQKKRRIAQIEARRRRKRVRPTTSRSLGDHNYAGVPDTSDEEDQKNCKEEEMERFDPTMAMDMFYQERLAQDKLSNKNKYRIAMLREQILYLHFDTKGMELNFNKMIRDLQIPPSLIQHWIRQATRVNELAAKAHKMRSCGKIQELIFRLMKLNPNLTVTQMREIMRHADIMIGRTRLERSIDNIRYMLHCPDDFSEDDDDLIDKIDVDWINNRLATRIAAALSEDRENNNNAKPPRLTLQQVLDRRPSELIKPTHNAKCTKVAESKGGGKVSSISNFYFQFSESLMENENFHSEDKLITENGAREKEEKKEVDSLMTSDEALRDDPDFFTYLDSLHAQFDYEDRKQQVSRTNKTVKDWYEELITSDQENLFLPEDDIFFDFFGGCDDASVSHLERKDNGNEQFDSREMEKLPLPDQCMQNQSSVSYESRDEAKVDIDGKSIANNLCTSTTKFEDDLGPTLSRSSFISCNESDMNEERQSALLDQCCESPNSVDSKDDESKPQVQIDNTAPTFHFQTKKEDDKVAVGNVLAYKSSDNAKREIDIDSKKTSIPVNTQYTPKTKLKNNRTFSSNAFPRSSSVSCKQNETKRDDQGDNDENFIFHFRTKVKDEIDRNEVKTYRHVVPIGNVLLSSTTFSSDDNRKRKRKGGETDLTFEPVDVRDLKVQKNNIGGDIYPSEKVVTKSVESDDCIVIKYFPI